MLMIKKEVEMHFVKNLSSYMLLVPYLGNIRKGKSKLRIQTIKYRRRKNVERC
jgi:hypothetical protein